MKRSEMEKLIDNWLDESSVITGKSIISWLEFNFGITDKEHLEKLSEYLILNIQKDE